MSIESEAIADLEELGSRLDRYSELLASVHRHHVSNRDSHGSTGVLEHLRHVVKKMEQALGDHVLPAVSSELQQERPSAERFDLQFLIRVGLQTLRATQREILEGLRDDRDGVLEPIRLGTRDKPALAIDLIAERNASRRLHRALRRYDPLILGEESLRDEALDLRHEDRLVVIMDMVDGTDLLARGLGNWCSAMVFYCPRERRILAAFVALPANGVYFATEKHATMKCRYQGTPRLIPVRGPSAVERLADSAVAFYGQKLANFATVADNTDFLNNLMRLKRECSEQGRPFCTRIFNLGGGPAITHLFDGPLRIDAVFELHGQAAHDFVPGAYLAVRAGVNLSDLTGNPIDLLALLERPAGSRVRYLLTSTENLGRELRGCLSSQPHVTVPA